MRHVAWVSFLVVLGLRCAPGERAPEVAQRQLAIVGGAADTTSSDVYVLGLSYDNGRSGLCSAVLLAPHTLLTAAHCVDPRLVGAATVTVKATNKATDVGLMASDLIAIGEVRLNPMWNTSQPRAYDLALLELTVPSTVATRPINRAALTGFTGQSVTAVGYGRLASSDPASSGTRRAVDTAITAVGARTFDLGVDGVRGICEGDSGGPTFLRFPDGVQRLVGIHSGGTGGACGDGVDVRVDTQLAFLEAWLAVKDPPPAGCGADGACATGCGATVDPDCACAADGQCTAACANLATDPDCPADCSANGVCAAASCPRADPDCLAAAATCTADAQCESKVCGTDPVSAERYCTLACTAGGAPCPAGLACDASLRCLKPGGPLAALGDPCTAGTTRCEVDSVCSGRLGGASTCRPSCGPGGACPEGTSCVDGLNAARYCGTMAPTPPPTGPGMGEVRGGCSAVPGAPLFALLLGLLHPRRRARSARSQLERSGRSSALGLALEWE